MDPEKQQRMLQKQASQIGNLMFAQTAATAELEMMQEQIESLQAQLAAQAGELGAARAELAGRAETDLEAADDTADEKG